METFTKTLFTIINGEVIYARGQSISNEKRQNSQD
jgi:hypothetical protein